MTQVLFTSEHDNEVSVGTEWEDTKQYFSEFMQAEIEHYEKVHRTIVQYICLAGKVGRWDGKWVGGKQLNYDNNPLDCMGQVDDITVRLDEDRAIEILGHHHDATHIMNIYIIPEGTYNRWDNKGMMDSPEFYAWLVENRRPVRLRKANKYYTV